MSRYHSHMTTALKLVDQYKADVPFAVFLKYFFSANKKFGSKDRKEIASLCYNYFRIGAAAANRSPEERLIIATFLCTAQPNVWMQHIKPDWNEPSSLPLDKKLKIVKDDFSSDDIFPFREAFSDLLNKPAFYKSFLVQPKLFLRIRPQSKLTVAKKLEKLSVEYDLPAPDCIALPINTKADDYFITDKEVVIQDYSSQQVLNYLRDKNNLPPSNQQHGKRLLSVWDCCAASGGKSILATDIIGQKFDLTVSDIRTSIIANLHQRFKKANIKSYKYFIADIGSKNFDPPATDFDMVICDAPCSGSGTWSRTPEQLSFFKSSSIDDYNFKQKNIISNAIPQLKKDGLFFYITCSVFKKENEDIVDFIKQQYQLELLQMALVQGHAKKADTLFVAVFKK